MPVSLLQYGWCVILWLIGATLVLLYLLEPWFRRREDQQSAEQWALQWAFAAQLPCPNCGKPFGLATIQEAFQQRDAARKQFLADHPGCRVNWRNLLEVACPVCDAVTPCPNVSTWEEYRIYKQRQAQMEIAAERHRERCRFLTEVSKRRYGDTCCAGCGKRLIHWADSGAGVCAYCRHPLPSVGET